MKITFLVSGNARSNFAYRALALARALHAQGHNVSIIAPKADKYNNFQPENIASIDGVRILQPFQFATKRLEINLLPYLFGATRMAIKENPDLIYIYKPTPINIIGFIPAFLRKTPVVVDFDDLGSDVMKIEGHPGYQRKLVAWAENFSAKHADRLVVASTFLLEKYHKEFPGKPIHVMPNGVEDDWFGPLTSTKEKQQIVFMGSMNRRTILEPFFKVLPEIITRHPDLKVLMIGAGKELEYFKHKVRNLNIASSVEFTGWLNIEDARSRLHAGDIGYCYMPDELTIKAASNMKVSQYMARGIVPFVSDVGDLPATVDFGNAGYICKSDDMKALKIGLLKALEDSDRLSKVRQARTFVAQKFNWNILASDFYTWLVPGRVNNRQKIYVIATAVPGNFGGGEIRNYNLIKQLVKRVDAEVEVFCISQKSPDAARKNFESEVAARCHVVPARKSSFAMKMKAFLLERLPPFMIEHTSTALGEVFMEACKKSLPDIVHIEQLQGYYCIRPYMAWLKHQGVKIVFDCHNIEFQSFDESLDIFSLPKKIVGKFLVPRMKNMEIEAARIADAILACSVGDTSFFKKYNLNTYVVPNGVNCLEFQSIHHNQNVAPTLVFTGSIQYPPNADAMQFYLTDIHPKVKKQMPNVKLLAIGTTKAWLDSVGVSDSSIEPLGFVEDIRPYFQEAVIGICPVRYGSGTRIKIMTYMAAGLPVVSTSKGAEGVTYVDGRDIIITDDPEKFEEAILRLLHDKNYRDEFGRNGRKFISQNYDWNVIGKILTDIYQNDLR